ncbi:hypothetical protein [Nocardia sp. alder85J]|uniref:hypothetical protein n=1 Tax=Nocardia sp. alder85J TaxID=2862949 RepID=UPI00224E9CA4|nr:hypothetical protein [Nocardia sp. alder85J]MCX4090913.1 hypothetical protein [Nocardia sp. alder85J]
MTAPIPRIALAVHHAVHRKPSWKDRKLKYALIMGIGEYWSSERLAPADTRRLDGGDPAPLYDLIDTKHGSAIHVVYREEGGESRAVFVCLGFDPPKAGNLYSEKLARRVVDFLGEAGAYARVERLKI